MVRSREDLEPSPGRSSPWKGMGDSSDLKRTSRRAKKRPNFFKAEPATLASAGDFAKPPAAAPKRKRQASTTLESGEKKLKDEAGDSQLQFTETADLCEVVDRSGPDAFNSPLVKDATEVLIERFSASPQPCADEAAVEESQLLLTEDLPPELRQDVTCNEAAGSNQVNMSFPLQGAFESGPLVGISAAPATADPRPLFIDPAVTPIGPAIKEHSPHSHLREPGQNPVAVSSQETQHVRGGGEDDGTIPEAARGGLRSRKAEAAVATPSQPVVQLSPTSSREEGSRFRRPATAGSSQEVHLSSSQPAQHGLKLLAHQGLRPTAASKLAIGRKSTVIGGGIGQIRLATSRPEVVNITRSETASGRSSPVDSPSEEESSRHLETDSDLELRMRKRTLEKELLTLLAQLTRNRDSIMKATQHVIHGVELGLAQSYCRTVVEQIQKETSSARRINLLYLMDSVIQTSQRPTRPKCGPTTEAGILFRKLGAAALPHLISAVSSDAEGLEKAKKVLSLWLERQLLPESVINPHLKQLKAIVTESQVHAKHVVTLPQGLATVTAELENQYGSMNTLPALQVASEGEIPMSVHIHLKDDGEAWEDEMEEEESNSDNDFIVSPTEGARGWGAVSADVPLPDDSPWATGLSSGLSSEGGAQSSPVEGFGPLWQQTASFSQGNLESFKDGRAGDGVSSIQEAPRLMYDTPSMDAVRPSCMYATQASSMADIVNDGNLCTDEDWDPPQLPAQNVQAQFGSLPPGLASPSADSMAPAPNSNQIGSRLSTLAKATGGMWAPRPPESQRPVWNLHGNAGEPQCPVQEPLLAGELGERQWPTWDLHDRSAVPPPFASEEQRTALNTNLGEVRDIWPSGDARGQSTLAPPLSCEQHLPGLEPLLVSAQSSGQPALPQRLPSAQQRPGLGPLLAGEIGSSPATGLNEYQWRRLALENQEPALSSSVKASVWMAQGQVSTQQTSVGYRAGANEATASPFDTQHSTPFLRHMSHATADVHGQSLDKGDFVHGHLRQPFLSVQDVSADAVPCGNTGTVTYCAEDDVGLPPLPDDPPLPEEEAPPLPPEEPPEPPLPPEVDQPVDEDVYPPMPDSPPPLPPDDAQWHPLESTVQIAVPQAVRGTGGAEMEDLKVEHPLGRYYGRHVDEAHIEGLLGPNALPLQQWTRDDASHKFEQRQADSYGHVSQWGQHWEQPCSAAHVTTYPSYP